MELSANIMLSIKVCIEYQLVAVETAAPLVFIGRELISVGHDHGTPSIPIPNEM